MAVQRQLSMRGAIDCLQCAEFTPEEMHAEDTINDGL